jgi:hypothetical protein
MATGDNLKKALVVSMLAMAVSSLGLANNVTIELAQEPMMTPTIEILA